MRRRIQRGKPRGGACKAAAAHSRAYDCRARERRVEIQQALLDALYSLGAKRDSDPLIALSFMALPVIPAVKLTDEGLFDAVNFKFIKYN